MALHFVCQHAAGPVRCAPPCRLRRILILPLKWMFAGSDQGSCLTKTGAVVMAFVLRAGTLLSNAVRPCCHLLTEIPILSCCRCFQRWHFCRSTSCSGHRWILRAWVAGVTSALRTCWDPQSAISGVLRRHLQRSFQADCFQVQLG
jgi:hypothetical protein